ncbi:MAG: hypothetical protein NZM12_04745, partial [Steroidobacteraceae bacterium]|nr:hypothetical protein [Steroidobacteraceae bacterium]MDW8260024.1 M17 family peptidase N-terminal domain-containing protein [Gammaproteobacteria bacterium]
MQFDVFTTPLAQLAVDCIAVGVFDDAQLSSEAQALDRAAGGRLSRAVGRGDYALKVGETALLVDLPGLAAPRVLLVGQGPRDRLTRKSWRRALGQAAAAVARTQARSAAFALARPPARELDDYLAARS